MATSFLGSLLGSRVRVIMEIKRQDGHGEDLLRGRSVTDVLSAYRSAAAPCLSVVTGRWFGGDDQLLDDVARLGALPILKKDFITRDSQIVAAKASGASAVLLTAGILPAQVLRRRIGTALREGLTPFVEAASEAELEAVVHGEQCIVAINNKDIRHRERDRADLDRSLALLGAARATGTPCPVSASGIEDPADAARLLDAGYEGVLVGSGLLRADSVSDWIGDLQCQRRAGVGG